MGGAGGWRGLAALAGSTAGFAHNSAPESSTAGSTLHLGSPESVGRTSIGRTSVAWLGFAPSRDCGARSGDACVAPWARTRALMTMGGPDRRDLGSRGSFVMTQMLRERRDGATSRASPGWTREGPAGSGCRVVRPRLEVVTSVGASRPPRRSVAACAPRSVSSRVALSGAGRSAVGVVVDADRDRAGALPWGLVTEDFRHDGNRGWVVGAGDSSNPPRFTMASPRGCLVRGCRPGRVLAAPRGRGHLDDVLVEFVDPPLAPVPCCGTAFVMTKLRHLEVHPSSTAPPRRFPLAPAGVVAGSGGSPLLP